MRSRSTCFCVALFLSLAPAVRATDTPPVNPPVTVAPEVREKLARLRSQAVGRDFDKALAAIAELKTLGEPGRIAVAAVTASWLERDGRQIHSLALRAGRTAGILAAEEQMLDLQKKAVDNIAVLDHGPTLEAAHRYYDQLAVAWRQLEPLCEARGEMIEPLERRAKLLELHRTADPAAADFPAQDEKALLAQAEAALGAPLKTVSAAIDPTTPDASVDAALRLMRIATLGRRIERFNRGLEKFMSNSELDNARLVNAYRESLGLLPLELDPRLVQSARRHSKEMVDLGYFSHESPTASEKSFVMREANAGYEHPTGENIAGGYGSGPAAFWGWFDSPGHHKNMAGGHTALGVGRWGVTWTQNFGSGPRALTMTEAERAKIAIKGDVLGPKY